MAITKPTFGTPLNTAHWAASGLVGCWLFNEGSGITVYDSSGNRNNGTLTNMAGTSTSGWTSGMYGNALAFNGDNDFINCGASSTSLYVPANGNLTVLSHFYIATGAIQHCIFLRGQNGSDYNYGLEVLGTTLFFSNGNNDYTLGCSVPINVWNTIGFVSSGGSTTGFVNGVFGSPIAFGPRSYTGGYQYIGAIPTSLQRPVNGRISDIMIWNRALSVSEIAYLTAFPFCMFDPLYQNVRQIYSIPRGIY